MPFFVLLLIFLASSPCYSQMPDDSPGQVWQVGERRWTIEEEQRFAKWVEEAITEDFFIRHRIPTDCADAVYAIRWIYARIAHLPAAATTREGRRIGHWSTDWRHLRTDPEWDKDERFLAALFYLFPRTWTGTLPLDTYPVRISPDSVIPGTLFLVSESHTGIVGHVSRDGSHAHPLQTWESALPVRIQKLTRVMGTITRLLRERVPIVLEGYQNCENGGCPEGSETFEIYSTHGRDEMIVSLMDHLARIIESSHFDPKMAKGMMEAIPIKISENPSVTFNQVYQNHPWLSHDPRDSIEARWGFKKCEMIHEENRITNDSIAFISRAYRKKDPGYADFSIRQQQHLLGKLNEEWTLSGCAGPPPAPAKKLAVLRP